jgi:hypothetical protein
VLILWVVSFLGMVLRNCLAEHYCGDKEEKAVKLPPPSTGLRQAADAVEEVWTPIFTKLGEYESSGFSSKEAADSGNSTFPRMVFSASHHSFGNHLPNPAESSTLLAANVHLEHSCNYSELSCQADSMDWANRCSLSRLAICPVCPPPHTSLWQHVDATLSS